MKYIKQKKHHGFGFQNRGATEWGSVYKKDTRYKRGHKTLI